MIECTLINIHTGGEIKYSFEVLPRVDDCIMIDTLDIRDNQEWQDLVGADEDDPRFEGMSTRTFNVCNVNYRINTHHQTSIEILLDEFYGEEDDL